MGSEEILPNFWSQHHGVFLLAPGSPHALKQGLASSLILGKRPTAPSVSNCSSNPTSIVLMILQILAQRRRKALRRNRKRKTEEHLNQDSLSNQALGQTVKITARGWFRTPLCTILYSTVHFSKVIQNWIAFIMCTFVTLYKTNTVCQK